MLFRKIPASLQPINRTAPAKPNKKDFSLWLCPPHHPIPALVRSQTPQGTSPIPTNHPKILACLLWYAQRGLTVNHCLSIKIATCQNVPIELLCKTNTPSRGPAKRRVLRSILSKDAAGCRPAADALGTHPLGFPRFVKDFPGGAVQTTNPAFLQGATAFQLVNDAGAQRLSQQPPAHDPRKSFSGPFFPHLTDARLSPERHTATD